MPVLRLTHRSRFCAALRLASPQLDEEENRAAYGACYSPHYHGHDYTLEVTVAGEPDPRTGILVDYRRLADLVEERILRHVDHRNLNEDVAFLAGVVPTSENLARRFWERLAAALPPGLRLVELRLQEGPDDWVALAET